MKSQKHLTRSQIESRAGVSLLFMIMGYYMLRIIRDELATQLKLRTLTTMFIVIFVLICCSFFLKQKHKAWLLLSNSSFSLIKISAMLPFIYWFLGCPMVLSLPLFVWISVFPFFLIPTFWGNISELLRAEHGLTKSLNKIGLMGSVGAIIGPMLTLFLTQQLDVKYIACVSSICYLIVWWLVKENGLSQTRILVAKPISCELKINKLERKTLYSMTGYLLLYGCIMTTLYLLQIHFLSSVKYQEDRFSFLGQVELIANSSTGLLQLKLAQSAFRWSVKNTLLILPVGLGLGICCFQWHTQLWGIALLLVMMRVINFVFLRPSKELIWLALPKTLKYQSKALVEAGSIRLGNMLGGVILPYFILIKPLDNELLISFVVLVTLLGVCAMCLGNNYKLIHNYHGK